MSARVGDRVRVLPHEDAFMRGVRYGIVARVSERGALTIAPEIDGAPLVRVSASGYEVMPRPADA